MKSQTDVQLADANRELELCCARHSHLISEIHEKYRKEIAEMALRELHELDRNEKSFGTKLKKALTLSAMEKASLLREKAELEEKYLQQLDSLALELRLVADGRIRRETALLQELQELRNSATREKLQLLAQLAELEQRDVLSIVGSSMASFLRLFKKGKPGKELIGSTALARTLTYSHVEDTYVDEQNERQVALGRYEVGDSTSNSGQWGALLGMNGSIFIKFAYREILSRDADAAGLEHYLTRLEAGEAKMAIVQALWNSPEAMNLRERSGENRSSY